MPVNKIYSCCICHKILTDYKPHRLVHQEYSKRGYGQYRVIPGNNFDFCNDCFKVFVTWISQNSKKVNK